MTYETRPISWLVGPKDCSIYDDMATTVSIDDEGGGEYVLLRQVGETHDGEIRINPDQWPALKAAIEAALSYVK